MKKKLGSGLTIDLLWSKDDKGACPYTAPDFVVVAVLGRSIQALTEDFLSTCTVKQ